MQAVYRPLRIVVGYLAALYLGLVLFMVLYGVASPRPGDLRALERAGLGGDPAVLVGLLVAEEKTPYRMRFEDRRYYAALPASLSEQVLWAVVQENSGPVSVRRSSAAFWGVLGSLLASLAGFWWCWLRPVHAHGRDKATEPDTSHEE